MARVPRADWEEINPNTTIFERTIPVWNTVVQGSKYTDERGWHVQRHPCWSNPGVLCDSEGRFRIVITVNTGITSKFLDRPPRKCYPFALSGQKLD